MRDPERFIVFHLILVLGKKIKVYSFIPNLVARRLRVRFLETNFKFLMPYGMEFENF